jgi:putative ABC transport system ATP-binding protein
MSEVMRKRVVATQVVKVYRGLTEEVQAVRGVDLVLEPGSLTAVLGPSGSGKSTLIRLIAGLDRPSAGTVTHGDTVLTELSSSRLRRWRRRNVAFVHQRPRSNLIEHLTAADHLRMVGERDTGEVLGSLGLGEQSRHRVDQLSGGEQQRLAIARAVVNRPALLIADEPTANLDAESAARIIDTFVEFNRVGVTVLIATHDRGLVERYGGTRLHIENGTLG